jgi:hypothetical protein
MLTLATAVSERGELVLLRRADGALELRVNGAFAMDTAQTSSERLLATAALLDRAAAEVEEQQRARERKLEELRRELAPGGVP